jgi:phage gp37-like protein
MLWNFSLFLDLQDLVNGYTSQALQLCLNTLNPCKVTCLAHHSLNEHVL